MDLVEDYSINDITGVEIDLTLNSKITKQLFQTVCFQRNEVDGPEVRTEINLLYNECLHQTRIPHLEVNLIQKNGDVTT